MCYFTWKLELFSNILWVIVVYANDPPSASHLSDPATFADETNFFFNGKDIKNLFVVVNKELVNNKDCLTANKLSLNVEKKLILP